MINDLVSVLIPAYNHERYIEECIRSIIGQTYKDIELIVIDDGSTDDTFAKLLKLKPECEKRFTRVVFKTQKNSGTRVTSNRLLHMAQGRYVFGIASDDVAKTQAIEILCMFLAKNPDYVLAVGDNEIIDENSKQISYKTFGDELHINVSDNKHPNFGNYTDLLKGNYIPNGYLYLRQTLLDAGGFDETILLEDWYMHLQLSKVGKYKYIPEILYSYRRHSHNTISSSEFKSRTLEIYRQIYEHEKEYCFTHGYKKQWERQWCKRFGWRAKWKALRDFLRRKK